MTQSAVALGELQERIADAARVEERLRLARGRPRRARARTVDDRAQDDLVPRSSSRTPSGPPRAVQALHLARLVATDVDASTRPAQLHDRDRGQHRGVRAWPAADVRADIEVDPDLPELDALAAVLREAHQPSCGTGGHPGAASS